MTLIYVSASTQPGNPYTGVKTNEMEVMHRLQNDHVVPKLNTLKGVKAVGSKFRKQGQYVNAAQESNRLGADLHVSLHSDAGSKSRFGSHTIYHPSSSKGKRLAGLIQKPLSPVTPWEDFGIVGRTDLYEIKATKAVAVLTEVSFHDKAKSAIWITQNLDKIADGIVAGIAEYLGAPYKAAPAKAPAPAAKAPAAKPAAAPSTGNRTRGPFPLPKDHWYGPTETSKSHSGKLAKDRTAIKQIQAVVGVKVDGWYGANTKKAVEAYQKSRGLRVDGGVGPETWTRMNRSS